MAMNPLKPALQSSQGRSSDWGGASLVNCYAEKADGDKRADFAVMALPGLDPWATVGLGPFRGGVVMGRVLYVVSGVALYSVQSDGTSAWCGSIAGTGPVGIAANYTQIAIAAAGNGYVYSGGSVHTPVGFDVSDVTYADGYMLWTIKDSEQFIISALDDAMTYDPTDIASVEGAPDDVVGVVNNHREIFFPGNVSSEIYYNTGDTNDPFQRQGNAFVERGCFDRNSIVKLDNSVTMLGNDRIVYNMVGYQPQRISTHAIEYLLRGIDSASAFSFAQEGHTFYVLDCGTDVTAVFDHATGAWHTRKSQGASLWKVNGSVSAYGKTILGNRNDGKLYLPSFDVFDEDGDAIEVEIILPTIEANGERLAMYAFEAVIETGVGNLAAPTPQIMLQYSDVGGHLWSNELWRAMMGSTGDYRRRAIWRKLGQFRQRQIKLRITDPVRKMVISYRAEIA